MYLSHWSLITMHVMRLNHVSIATTAQCFQVNTSIVSLVDIVVRAWITIFVRCCLRLICMGWHYVTRGCRPHHCNMQYVCRYNTDKESSVKIFVCLVCLSHWGRVTHKLIIIGSNNGLSPDRRQAIIWTNARLLPIGPLRTYMYFNENLIKIQQFSLKKMHVKMSSAKWRPSCLGLNVFNNVYTIF